MNLLVFYLYLSLMLLLPCAFSKSLPNIGGSDNDPEENPSSDEMEALHEAHRSQKRIQDSHIKKHNRGIRADDETTDSMKRQCAIMYKDEEPVGILQPFKDSYQLLPVHNDETIPVEISPIQRQDSEGAKKRDTEAVTAQQLDDETMKNGDYYSHYADEKYPYIFAKFKIDSKVEKEGSPPIGKNVQKRESENPSLISDKHVSSLKSALSRIETSDEVAQADLKGILKDMGLIDDSHIDKREAELIEDEDLEHGTNKINLIKIASDDERPKRDDESINKKEHEKASTKEYGIIGYPEPKSISEDEYIDQYINKHPEKFESNEREKRSEDVSKEMEKQLKERLQKIKEEVRNEIESLKASNGNNEDLEEDDEDEEGKSQRRKRNVVNSLVDQETSNLDPVLFGDNNLVPHIRRRRSLDQQPEKIANVPQIYKDVADNGISCATSPSNQYHQEHFLMRNLKLYRDDTNNNYEDLDQSESDENKIRDKKDCQCTGKNCKCPHPQKSARTDDSNFLYFDGALMMPEQPFYGIHQDTDTVSMQLLPKKSNNKRSDRHSARTQTDILRGLRDGGYILDMDPDIYRITNENPNSPEARKKRDSFADLVAIHGGGPAMNHLVAIRERSMLPRLRSKRNSDRTQPQQLALAEMSDEDLFGALPQSFDGELARFKRV